MGVFLGFPFWCFFFFFLGGGWVKNLKHLLSERSVLFGFLGFEGVILALS